MQISNFQALLQRTIRIFFLFIASLAAIIILSSSITIREWLAAPLVVHNPNAYGDACYVLEGGDAIWERLSAGADLLQMRRVPTLILTKDDTIGRYNFKAHASWTESQWETDYLLWRGISSSSIHEIPSSKGFFGTLTEARNVAKHLPANVKTLVIVSSAPHMRRAVLAFRRSLPAGVEVVPYAATSYDTSAEMYYPIWIEYLKLFVYFFIA